MHKPDKSFDGTCNNSRCICISGFLLDFTLKEQLWARFGELFSTFTYLEDGSDKLLGKPKPICTQVH